METTSQQYAAYEQRNQLLKTLGYESYAAYLASPLWAGIRARCLSRDNNKCTVCRESRAWTVHHLNYEKATLTGADISGLVSVCGDCHHILEIDTYGRKVSLEQANKSLAEITGWQSLNQQSRTIKGRKQYLCACRKWCPMDGSKICRKCAAK